MNLFKNLNISALKHLVLMTTFLIGSIQYANAEVTLENNVKISDMGLHFDGQKVGFNAPDNGTDSYDYHFGRNISAHGDAVKTFKHYVFMTWYRGGKDDRHMMLSRYNTQTGVVKSIEFPHRHTGFRGDWWIGESHNTIGLSVSPVNGTIHMVFDMHAYDDNNHGGKFKDDFFRYTYSVAGAAEVADDDFTLEQFVEDTSSISQSDESTGYVDYKHISMTGDIADKGNFARLTYPQFFTTTDGTLLLYMRLGGNNNGAYVFNRYDANTQTWSKFTPFNRNNQKSHGNEYNWGLYGNMKYVNGKLRVGFQQRSSDNTDKYLYQNGVYYAYSDHPEGFGDWKNHRDEPITWPLVDSDEIKVFEPGDYISHTEANSVHIVGSFDWTVTEKGDIHTISLVRSTDRNRPDFEQQYIHAYKPAGAEEFIIDTDFVGASEIYTAGDNVYIIGLKNGRPFVEKAVGGTSDFERVYEETDGPVFDHGTVYVKDGKVYYYLMERTSGNAMPLHLQVIDLDVEADATRPIISFPNSSVTVQEGYEKLTLELVPTSPVEGRTIESVTLYINDELVRVDDRARYIFGHGSKPHETGAMGWLDTHEPNPNPLGPGVHTFKAVALDSEGQTSSAFMRLTVTSLAPTVAFPNSSMSVDVGYEQLSFSIDAQPSSIERPIESVTLYLNGELVRVDTSSPYNFGHKFKPYETGAMGWISCDEDPVPNPCHEPNPNPLGVGVHTFTAVALDSAGGQTEATMVLTVNSVAPTIAFPNSSLSVDLGYEQLGFTLDAQPSSVDRPIESVTLYLNGELVRVDNSVPYNFGHRHKPHETGAMGWISCDQDPVPNPCHEPNPNPLGAGVHIFTAVALDSAGGQAEATMELTVNGPPQPPIVSFPKDVYEVTEGYQQFGVTLNAESPVEGRTIASVTLYRNGELVRVDTKPVWNFGHRHAPYELGAMGWISCDADPVPSPCHQPNPNPLLAGEHTFTAVAKDSEGLESETSMTLIVKPAVKPTINFVESDISLTGGYDSFSLSVDIETANEIEVVGLYIDDSLVRELLEAPYTWGGEFYETELLGLTAGTHAAKAVVTDNLGQMSEATLMISVGIFGDLNDDGVVDNYDRRAFILAVRNREITNLNFDFNGDGVVSSRDVRGFNLLCALPRCAVAPVN